MESNEMPVRGDEVKEMVYTNCYGTENGRNTDQRQR